MIDELLSLRFKGDRDYLHGTDMYDAVTSAATRDGKEVGRHRFAIHAFARRQCRLLMSSPDIPLDRPQGVAADFTLDTSLGKVTGYLCETERPVDGRYAFDETRIVSRPGTDGSSAQIVSHDACTPIEALVILTKQLHNGALPRPGGKWVFSRLELARALRHDDTNVAGVVLRHNFNDRLTKCEVLCADEAIGHIYFSLWRP